MIKEKPYSKTIEELLVDIREQEEWELEEWYYQLWEDDRL